MFADVSTRSICDGIASRSVGALHGLVLRSSSGLSGKSATMSTGAGVVPTRRARIDRVSATTRLIAIATITTLAATMRGVSNSNVSGEGSNAAIVGFDPRSLPQLLLGERCNAHARGSPVVIAIMIVIAIAIMNCPDDQYTRRGCRRQSKWVNTTH